MPYELEVTDTFGGEANYCWVKRGTTRATTRRGIVKAVKELAGWQGWCRVHVENYGGDMYTIRPTQTSGVLQIAFATWRDDPDEVPVISKPPVCILETVGEFMLINGEWWGVNAYPPKDFSSWYWVAGSYRDPHDEP